MNRNGGGRIRLRELGVNTANDGTVGGRDSGDTHATNHVSLLHSV